ncbi:hypothetical protein EGX89_00425 (plasmid) [Citrobacter freundii]|nr:hypothetical protein EGX89_00425 [Citrobacter freundii]
MWYLALVERWGYLSTETGDNDVGIFNEVTLPLYCCQIISSHRLNSCTVPVNKTKEHPMNLYMTLAPTRSRQIFTDVSIINDMTGAQYEGINIFERQTRHFWVFGEAWNDMPPLMRPDAEQQQLWLTEIFNHGSAVVTVGLVVYRDFDMTREGERSAGVCIIRPGAPVRHWLPLKALHALADEVRQRIIHDRELTSSFS